MSEKLINAIQVIKEECSKHLSCENCFYGIGDEESFFGCVMDAGCDLDDVPSDWDLSLLKDGDK